MVRMDPLSFLIAHDTIRRSMEGATTGGPRRRRPAIRARRVRT
jgi:hypothetical protein